MHILDSTGNHDRKRQRRDSNSRPRHTPTIYPAAERAWQAAYDDVTRCSEAITLPLDIADALITRIEHHNLDPSAARSITTLYAELNAIYETNAALYTWSNGALDHLCYGINQTTTPKQMRRLYNHTARPLRKALKQ